MIQFISDSLQWTWTFFNLCLGIMTILTTLYGFWHIVKDIRSYNRERRAENNKISYCNDEFARDTIKFRFKDIITRVNKHNPKKNLSYKSFSEEIFNPVDLVQKLPYYEENSDVLNTWAAEQNRQTYKIVYDFMTKAPFIDVEHYFYFWIIAKINEESTEFIDPFAKIKEEDLINDISADGVILGEDGQIHKSKIIKAILNYNEEFGTKTFDKEIHDILNLNLSSNSNDLSQMAWNRSLDTTITDDGKEIEDFVDYISSCRNQVKTINYLVDNSGVEVFNDLVLALLLVNRQFASQVVFHVNVLPVFVSDVIHKDIEGLIDKVKEQVKILRSTQPSKLEDQKKWKEEHSDADFILHSYDNQQFDKIDRILDRLHECLTRKNKSTNEQVFVVKPSFEWNMPTLYKDLLNNKDVFDQTNSMLIVKGDLNYRRLVGDNQWRTRTSLNSIVKRYVKVPILVIRSFKSSVILDICKPQKWAARDPEWKTDGKYGTVRFLKLQKK